MTMIEKINTILDHGISFIASEQNRDGSFFSFSSADPHYFKRPRRYKTTFLTSMIASSVAECPQREGALELCGSAARYLLGQRSQHWSFNYWDRKSKQFVDLPYPDDLDDTFCALIALTRCRAAELGPAAMAAVVKLLVAAEAKPGGPYYTWLVAKTAEAKWRDIDTAVNANIAYLLKLKGVQIAPLEEYLIQAARGHNFLSVYYPEPYPVVYFLSRALGASGSDGIADLLLRRRQNGNWGNPLDTALSAASLLNTGYQGGEIREAIESIIAWWEEELWQPYAFCRDPAEDGLNRYAGAPALTAAFCVEALQKYSDAAEQDSQPAMLRASSRPHKLHQAIVAGMQKKIGTAENPFGARLLKCLENLLSSDPKHEITLLPYFFSQDLKRGRERIAADSLLALGAANAWGWLAYRLYDDFLDGEGLSDSLPLANLALSESLLSYAGPATRHRSFLPLVGRTFRLIEEANYWEVSVCRFSPARKRSWSAADLPDYGDYSVLGRKSLGHALGPSVLLLRRGVRAKSSDMDNLFAAFRHYLIARQLNDDARDWRDDLAAGRLSSVATMILSRYLATGPKHITMTSMPLDFGSIFWNHVVDEVSQKIESHVASALEHYDQISVVKATDCFVALLAPLRTSASDALNRRNNVLEFLNSYKHR